MITIRLVLMVIASVLLLLAAANVVAPRLNLLALGMFFWALALVIG